VRRGALSLAILIGIAPSWSHGSGELRVVVDPDAYAVYSAILPQVTMVKHMKATSYVISSDTRSLDMCLVPDEESSALMEDAISSYIEQNAAPWRLLEQFTLALPYELCPLQTARGYKWASLLQFEQHHRKQSAVSRGEPDSSRTVTFEERFPGALGYVTLSAVGFNKDKTVAVVGIRVGCGPMCGSSGFHVLQRQGDSWVPLQWSGVECSTMSRLRRSEQSRKHELQCNG